VKKMTIEKAKAELQAAMSGPAGRHWNYGPAVSAVLEALEQAERRVAELEARTLTVKLPDGYVIRSGHPINEGERGVMIPKEGGDWLHRFDVEHALRVAGISAPLGETISNSADFAIDEVMQHDAALNQTHVKQQVSQHYKLVGEVVAWDHPTKERCVDFRWLNYDVAPGTKLYAMGKE